MAAPGGPCEWCGGPQLWTVIRGEMYVACRNGCLPLPMEGIVPDSHRSGEGYEGVDFHGGGGYLSHEGGAAEAEGA